MQKFLFYFLLMFFAVTHAYGSGYDDSDTTIINNYNTTVINNDAGSSAAIAASMGLHYFSRATQQWQGSVSGACWEFSEHCALSAAAAKRQGDFLWAVSISGNADEQMIGGSFGWTFGGN